MKTCCAGVLAVISSLPGEVLHRDVVKWVCMSGLTGPKTKLPHKVPLNRQIFGHLQKETTAQPTADQKMSRGKGHSH